MKKLLLFLLLMSISGLSWATSCITPSSSFTYISGNTILPNQVQTNENNLYTYLQGGVCQYQAQSITQAAISSTAGILYSQLNLSGGIVPSDINTSVTTNIYNFTGLNVASNSTTNSILYFNNTGNSFVPTQLGYSGPTYPYVKVSETQTSGTNAGTATSGSWITRVLNTTDTDTNGISSLNSNQVTLPAGTYWVRAYAPFIVNGAVQMRLFNVTGSSSLLIGTTMFLGPNSGGTTTGGWTQLSGLITLSTSSAIAIQYQVTNTQATDGLGSAAGFGTEVYTVAEFTKVK